MNSKRHYPILIFFSFCYITIGCISRSDNISIILDATLKDNEKVEISSIKDEVHTYLTAESNEISLPLAGETILDIQHEHLHSYIHVQAGQKVILDTIAKGPTLLGAINFSSKENSYLYLIDSIVIDRNSSYGTQFLAKNEPEFFYEKIKYKYQPLEDLLAEIMEEQDLSDFFKKSIQKRILSIRLKDLLTYESFYYKWYERIPSIPKDFFRELEDLDWSDPLLVIFNEGRELGSSWNKKDISYKDYDNLSNYFVAVYEGQDNLPSSLVRDFCRYSAIKGQITEGSGIDGAKDLITRYRESVSNSYFIKKLDEFLVPWLKISSGKQAPDFWAIKTNGDSIRLSDLRGRNIYIDVWATWCRPCIAEIPALVRLQKELMNDNIEFVSISIDRIGDKKKWLNFVDENNLSGLQLWVEDDWSSRLASSYKIESIPRFIYIDSQGRIVNSTAARPSSPDILNLLSN